MGLDKAAVVDGLERFDMVANRLNDQILNLRRRDPAHGSGPLGLRLQDGAVAIVPDRPSRSRVRDANQPSSLNDCERRKSFLTHVVPPTPAGFGCRPAILSRADAMRPREGAS